MAHLIEVILVSWVVISVPVSLFLGVMLRARNAPPIPSRIVRDPVGGRSVSEAFESAPAPPPARVAPAAATPRRRSAVAVKSRPTEGF